VFGVPIAGLLRRQQGGTLPHVLVTLLAHLKQVPSMNNEVLCIGGDPYAVSALQLNIERKSIDKVNLNEFEPVTIVGAIKIWLTKLPEPLIRQEQLDSYQLFKDRSNTVVNLVAFRQMVSELPEGFGAVLTNIIGFLHATGMWWWWWWWWCSGVGVRNGACLDCVALPLTLSAFGGVVDTDTMLVGMTWGHCIIRPMTQNIDTTLQVLWGAQVVSAMVTNFKHIFVSSFTSTTPATTSPRGGTSTTTSSPRASSASALPGIKAAASAASLRHATDQDITKPRSASMNKVVHAPSLPDISRVTKGTQASSLALHETG
jgi:hypothetical protein